MASLVVTFVDDPGRALEHASAPVVVITSAELRAGGAAGALRLLRGQRVDECIVVVGELRKPHRWAEISALPLVARARRRLLATPAGERLDLDAASWLSRELPFAARRALTTARVVRDVRRVARALDPATRTAPVAPRRVFMVRPDLGPALTAGGSLAHLTGVAGGFRHAGLEVDLVSPAPIPSFAERGRAVQVVAAEPRFEIGVELPHLAYNETLARVLDARLAAAGADLVYQRHALGHVATAARARGRGVPLVIEFNGPERWIAERWGSARAHLDLFLELERRALCAADLVLAVSEPLRPVLHALGVRDERILVNPNGVDPERFDAPRLAPERERYRNRIGARPDDIVAGFVGTFGPWHGAEVFAEALARLDPALPVRALFIGDGPRRAVTERRLEAAGLRERSHFTGLVPYAEAPGWLAACDIAVAPHVPNDDGTPFFGSPTKLFEYMCAGRAIVASDLDQLGTVLEHDRTAWLVPPSDAGALASALTLLAREPERRARLGAAARETAVRDHSWDAHVERLLERLRAGWS